MNRSQTGLTVLIVCSQPLLPGLPDNCAYSLYCPKYRNPRTVGASETSPLQTEGSRLPKGIIQKSVFSKNNYPSVVELNGMAAHHESQSSSYLGIP